MEPDQNAPGCDRRVYEIRRRRYMERLTQGQTASLMKLRLRHLNRLQREAVHALALRLWEHVHQQAPRHSQRERHPFGCLQVAGGGFEPPTSGL